jgi:hypothetical protein
MSHGEGVEAALVLEAIHGRRQPPQRQQEHRRRLAPAEHGWAALSQH